METLRDCRPTYIRLSRERSDRRYHIETGVFHSAGRLRRAQETTYADEDRLRGMLKWMDRHLPAPSDLNRIHSIFWFKAHVVSAQPELWKRIVELKELLERYSYRIELRETRRPGYIVYEDYYQIAAVPFKDTFKPR